jgi:hypothetical protein
VKLQWHHLTPQYLGGDPKGPGVYLPASYHQVITNAFRHAWAYGQGTHPTEEELQQIMVDVYSHNPLPGDPSAYVR